MKDKKFSDLAKIESLVMIIFCIVIILVIGSLMFFQAKLQNECYDLQTEHSVLVEAKQRAVDTVLGIEVTLGEWIDLYTDASEDYAACSIELADAERTIDKLKKQIDTLNAKWSQDALMLQRGRFFLDFHSKLIPDLIRQIEVWRDNASKWGRRNEQ